jgi:hypothetical protein
MLALQNNSFEFQDLCEGILLNLPHTDLLVASNVCNQWKQIAIKISDSRIKMWKSENSSIEIYDEKWWNKKFSQNFFTITPEFRLKNDSVKALILLPKNLTLQKLDNAVKNPTEGNIVELIKGNEFFQFSKELLNTPTENFCWIVVKKDVDENTKMPDILSLMAYAITRYVQYGKFPISMALCDLEGHPVIDFYDPETLNAMELSAKDALEYKDVKYIEINFDSILGEMGIVDAFPGHNNINVSMFKI